MPRSRHFAAKGAERLYRRKECDREERMANKAGKQTVAPR